MKGKVLIFLSIISLFVLPHIVMAVNPTNETFTVYKTELLMDRNATPQVILDNQAGVQSDIITNPESSFGTGSAPSGTYKRIHFVVKNSFSYSGPDPCGGQDPVSGTGLINPQQDPDAQVDLYFATSDDGGGSGWYNNGTADYPFLMQSPIVIASDKETTVKLIFNTANTLQCNASNTPVLFPPSMNVTSVIKDIAGACNITDAPYWFVHYNMSVWPRVCENPECTSYHFPETPQEIFENTTIVAGWGTVQFNENGTWQVDLSQDYTNGGMSEHRHELLELGPDDGYKDILGSGTITGTYTRSGNRIIMYFPEGGYIEGAVSSDCKTFTGVNITGDQENDLVFALKKGTGLSTIAQGKYLMSSPGFNLCYDVSGSNCFSSGDNKIKYLNYRNEISFIDTQLGGGTVGYWGNYFDYSPQYDQNGYLTGVNIGQPGEQLGLNIFPISSLTFRDDGLLTTTVEDPEFFAIGANRNGLFGAVATNAEEGNDRINVGFIVKIADNPVVSDLNGRWYISIIEAQVIPGSDGNWNTGDEGSWYGLTTGEVLINNGIVVSRSFTHKNVFDGSIEFETGSGETIQRKTECYKSGADALTTACSDPNAPRIPVFYIYGTGSEAGRIIAKMTIDSAKKALVFWAPVDLDNKPPTGACDPPREGYYCDSTGGSQKALFGVGVKIE
jgi:hypothetical protein